MSTTEIAADETVWISKNSRKRDTFHLKRDCPRLHDRSFLKDKRRGVLPSDWHVCSYCSGEDVSPAPEQHQTCGLCGNRVRQLAAHLRGGCD